MWNQSDWPGKQLLSDRPPLLICAVTLLSCTWSHPWSSIWSEDWHVVSWLYPGRTVLRKCESISTLCFNFVSSVLVSNQCLGICGHMEISLPDMHYSHLNKIFLSYMYGIHQVLFQNDSLATLLARVVGILGPIDPELLAKGRDTHKFFTKNHMLYERNQVCHYILSGGLVRTVVLV